MPQHDRVLAISIRVGYSVVEVRRINGQPHDRGCCEYCGATLVGLTTIYRPGRDQFRDWGGDWGDCCSLACAESLAEAMLAN